MSSSAFRQRGLRGWARRVIKRLIDVLLSALGLLALSPIMVVLAAAELWFHGWPPLFTQLRSGQNGRVFRLFKFRSMTNERGPDGELLSDERRLTPFGQWLRRTSLDELPQLLNILKGDMSVVGPRPLLPRYHTRYSPLQAFRLLAKPGLTGWAAVNGRSTNTWAERFAYDAYYVDHQSTLLDLRIIARTVAVVFRGGGTRSEGHVTNPEFGV
jgi:sugar transferase EpsL